MAQKYQVELSDGRKFVVESEGGPPSEEDVMAYLDQQQTTPPESATKGMMAQSTMAGDPPSEAARVTEGFKQRGGEVLSGLGAIPSMIGENVAAFRDDPMGELSEYPGRALQGVKEMVTAPFNTAKDLATGDAQTRGRAAMDALLMTAPLPAGKAATAGARGAGRGISRQLRESPTAGAVTGEGEGMLARWRRLGEVKADPSFVPKDARRPYVTTGKLPEPGPHTPSAAGYDQFAPNVSARRHMSGADVEAPPLVEPPSPVDRWMPNVSEAPASPMAAAQPRLGSYPTVQDIPSRPAGTLVSGSGSELDAALLDAMNDLLREGGRVSVPAVGRPGAAPGVSGDPGVRFSRRAAVTAGERIPPPVARPKGEAAAAPQTKVTFGRSGAKPATLQEVEHLFRELSQKRVLTPDESALLERLRPLVQQRASEVGLSYAARGNK